MDNHPTLNHQEDILNSLAQIIPSIPDFSCTDEDIDMSNPSNYTTAPKMDNHEINIRCICKSKDKSDDMIQCDTCKNWLHAHCICLKNYKQVKSFICLYCQYNVAVTVRSFFTSQGKKFKNVLDQIATQQEKSDTNDQPIVPPLLKVINEIERSLKVIPAYLPMRVNSSHEEIESDEEEDEIVAEDEETS